MNGDITLWNQYLLQNDELKHTFCIVLSSKYYKNGENVCSNSPNFRTKTPANCSPLLQSRKEFDNNMTVRRPSEWPDEGLCTKTLFKLILDYKWDEEYWRAFCPDCVWPWPVHLSINRCAKDLLCVKTPLNLKMKNLNILFYSNNS